MPRIRLIFVGFTILIGIAIGSVGWQPVRSALAESTDVQSSLAIALVIDDSGNMLTTDPNQRRRFDPAAMVSLLAAVHLIAAAGLGP